MPDRFPSTSRVINRVIEFAQTLDSSTPIFLGGKSFGGRMSSMTAAEYPSEVVKGIVFFGFPLHPAGSPGVDRAEHFKKVNIPLLFLQGSKDDLANLDLLTPIVSNQPKSTLVVFEGADHSFKAGKEDNLLRLADETVAWLRNVTRSGV